MARLTTLSDRVKLEIPTDGDLDTAQYARFTLDGVLDTLKDEVMEVHEILLQPRYPSNADGPFNQTGAFVPLWDDADGTNSLSPNFSDSTRYSALRMVTTTIAYQNIREMGVATPGVLSVEDHWTYTHVSSLRDSETPPAISGAAYGLSCEHGHFRYSVLDTQPMLIASDILIGVSADNWFAGNGEGSGQPLDLEIDVVIIGKVRKGTKGDLTELKEQNNIA